MLTMLGSSLAIAWLTCSAVQAQPSGPSAETATTQAAEQPAAPAASQAPEPDTRAGLIAAEQAAKSQVLKPYEPNKAEAILEVVEEQFLTGNLHWHPFFDSAYQGGGFTLGAGYLQRVGTYDTLDVRGSITFSNYKRIEAEYRAPRLASDLAGGVEQAAVLAGVGHASSCIIST